MSMHFLKERHIGLRIGGNAAQPHLSQFPRQIPVLRPDGGIVSGNLPENTDLGEKEMKEKSRCASFLFHVGLCAVFSESALQLQSWRIPYR